MILLLKCHIGRAFDQLRNLSCELLAGSAVLIDVEICSFAGDKAGRVLGRTPDEGSSVNLHLCPGLPALLPHHLSLSGLGTWGISLLKSAIAGFLGCAGTSRASL